MQETCHNAKRPVTVWKDGEFCCELPSVNYAAKKLRIARTSVLRRIKDGKVIWRHYQITDSPEHRPPDFDTVGKCINGMRPIAHIFDSEGHEIDKGTLDELSERHFVSPDAIRQDAEYGHKLDREYTVVWEHNLEDFLRGRKNDGKSV